jgi:hypothetical protein
MPDEKNDDFIDDWLNETDAPIVTRGYGPTKGPAEPDVAPPGRASLSPPEAGAEMAATEQGGDVPEGA